MDFLTPVDTPRTEKAIRLEDKILIMGSCFAEHIGESMEHNLLSTMTNPFGILYNPRSIYQILRLLSGMEDADRYIASFFFQDGMALWRNWLCGSSFFEETEYKCQEKMMSIFSQASMFYDEMDVMIITWGTNVSYELRGKNIVVGNCCKQKEMLFAEHKESVNEIVSLYVPLLSDLFAKNERLRVIFTVSPYRYTKYGLHESQLSKAILLLAEDVLVEQFPSRCCYFPSYEILMDELRDYRFYADDLLHPRDIAIDYIMDRFADSFYQEKTKEFINEWKRIRSAIEHRPLFPDTENYRRFVLKTYDRAENIKRKYPNFAEKIDNYLSDHFCKS